LHHRPLASLQAKGLSKTGHAGGNLVTLKKIFCVPSTTYKTCVKISLLVRHAQKASNPSQPFAHLKLTPNEFLKAPAPHMRGHFVRAWHFVVHSVDLQHNAI